MSIEIHPHARERMAERGATENEVVETVETGEKFPAKFGRIGYRHNFSFDGIWNGRRYNSKQVEAYIAGKGNDLIVVTVFVKYF